MRALRFAHNFKWHLLGQLAAFSINFFCIPYLIAHLGVDIYGVYILLFAIANYLSLLSFGSGAATIKYVAEFRGRADRRGLKDIVFYSVLIHACGAIVGASLLYWKAPAVVGLFKVPGHLAEAGVLAVQGVALGAVFAALIQFAASTLQGLQRFDLYSLVTFLQSGFMLLGAVAIVACGGELRGVIYWYVVLNASVCLLAAILIGTVLFEPLRVGDDGGLSFRPFFLLSFSSWLGMLAWIVIYQFDKIFITRAISLADLALYAVPAGLLQRLQILPAMVGSVIMPMLSEVQGPDSEETIRHMYLKAFRFLLWVVMPLLVFLFAFMPQFLTLWLGGRFGSQSVWPARLLVMAHMFSIFAAMPTIITYSRNHFWYLPALAWAQALISLVTWWLLIPRFNLLGVAMGSLLAQALPACTQLGYVPRRVLGISLARYTYDCFFRPLLVAAFLLALVFPFHALATTWVRLLLLVGSGGLLYCGAAWLFLEPSDRDLLRRLCRWEAIARGGGGGPPWQPGMPEP